MYGVSPSEYTRWPRRDQALVEALVEMDATTNEHGIPLELARDINVGFDVKFVKDYTVEAVQQKIKSEYGEKGLPPGVRPVVSINQKSIERRRRSAPSDRVHDHPGAAAP